MKVFVAGASGAIGRPLVRQLVAAGHAVTGTTRREERAAEIREAGAEPAIVDAYDAEALEAAARGASPEVVIHLLTALPQRFNPRSNYLTETNRIRTEGTRNLIAAARAAGARRLIAESVAFLYAPEGERIKTEEDRVNADAPGNFGDAMRALADLERQVAEAEGIDGVVLRYGWLYGPGTHFDRDGSQIEDLRRRRVPLVGDAEGIFSFINAEDAASATLAALESDALGVYNVVDDEPAPMREWVPALAEMVGAKPPRKVPLWLAKLIAGSAVAGAATEQRGASNAKAKRELGWEPSFPSWRKGFENALT
jgi:nucleoside-diphosphate-sugar epimerase